jgi:hypothetical protein
VEVERLNIAGDRSLVRGRKPDTPSPPSSATNQAGGVQERNPFQPSRRPGEGCIKVCRVPSAQIIPFPPQGGTRITMSALETPEMTPRADMPNTNQEEGEEATRRDDNAKAQGCTPPDSSPLSPRESTLAQPGFVYSIARTSCGCFPPVDTLMQGWTSPTQVV